MKKILILITLLLTITANTQAQTKVVNKNKMPKCVINFIESNYNDREVICYQIDFTNYNFNKIEDYEVLYENGTKLEFLKNGNLKSIDCGRLEHVKWDILPDKLSEFVITKFMREYVMEYSIEYKFKKPYKYEIELSNGLELTFNKKYKLIDID